MTKRQDSIVDLRSVSKNGGSKWDALRKPAKQGGLTWLEADPEELRKAIHGVTEDGGAILLSKTSDGGALVVQLLTDGGRFKLYPASTDELEMTLEHLTNIANSK